MQDATLELLAHPIELARLCAGAGASSFAVLLGEEFRACEPSMAATGAVAEADTGVVFEMEGAASGLVALLFPASQGDAVCASLGIEEETARRSALSEVGNIVVSRAVSAVANRIGARVLLSVPVLLSDAAGSTLERLLSRRGDASITTTELHGASGEPRALLVIAQDAVRSGC